MLEHVLFQARTAERELQFVFVPEWQDRMEEVGGWQHSAFGQTEVRGQVGGIWLVEDLGMRPLGYLPYLLTHGCRSIEFPRRRPLSVGSPLRTTYRGDREGIAGLGRRRRRPRRGRLALFACHWHSQISTSRYPRASRRLRFSSAKVRTSSMDQSRVWAFVSWNKNLQRMQNWAAKSTNLEENAWKVKSVFVIQWEQPCEPKSLNAALNIAGVEKLPSVAINPDAIWFEFWIKGALLTLESFVFCGWWFSNQFDMALRTHFSCNTAGRELCLAILYSLQFPETGWSIRIGKQWTDTELIMNWL